jgi:hypothetical protein
MEGNHAQALDTRHPEPPPRKYIYRSVEPVTDYGHPMRRSTDVSHGFQGITGQICPRPFLLNFRVSLKLN